MTGRVLALLAAPAAEGRSVSMAAWRQGLTLRQLSLPDQAVRLVELLDEAKQRCAEGMRERRGEDVSAAELDEAASVMGYGAVKYADLKNNRSTNYKCAAAAPATMLWAA